jgi:ribonuclease-3 family protein
LEELIKIEKEEQDINQMSPLVWAYVGDCVFELYVRTMLVDNTSLKPHRLHIESIKYVKAGKQAEMLMKIMDYLTDDEKEIVRRGRNAQNHHLPKNSNVREYMYSTAFEGLIGYLYLCGKIKRVKEIIELALNGKK